MLSENEHNIVREKILAHDAKFVQTVIIAKGDCAENEPRVEQFREEIHREYDGVVLRKEVIPNPPVRGPNGQAFIPLIDGAIPQRQKPFRQHGEKEQALIAITKQWLEAGFIEKCEDPRNEWLSQAFAVPKKSATFPWRGVVDMRGPNSQTRACNFPLPCIEDILVRQGKKLIFFSFGLKAGVPPNANGPCLKAPYGNLHPHGDFSMEGECNGTEECLRPIPKNDGERPGVCERRCGCLY
jgi:hypothetical protein